MSLTSPNFLSSSNWFLFLLPWFLLSYIPLYSLPFFSWLIVWNRDQYLWLCRNQTFNKLLIASWTERTMSFKKLELYPPNPSTSRGTSTKLSSSKDKVIYASGKTVIVCTLQLLMISMFMRFFLFSYAISRSLFHTHEWLSLDNWIYPIRIPLSALYIQVTSKMLQLHESLRLGTTAHLLMWLEKVWCKLVGFFLGPTFL